MLQRISRSFVKTAHNKFAMLSAISQREFRGQPIKDDCRSGEMYEIIFCKIQKKRFAEEKYFSLPVDFVLSVMW